MDYLTTGGKVPDYIAAQCWVDGVPTDPLVYKNVPPRVR